MPFILWRFKYDFIMHERHWTRPVKRTINIYVTGTRNVEAHIYTEVSRQPLEGTVTTISVPYIASNP